jgi:hypothetical protein
MLEGYFVFKKMKIHILVFWVMTPYCSLFGRYYRFGGTYFLHLHGSSLIMTPYCSLFGRYYRFGGTYFLHLHGSSLIMS